MVPKADTIGNKPPAWSDFLRNISLATVCGLGGLAGIGANHAIAPPDKPLDPRIIANLDGFCQPTDGTHLTGVTPVDTRRLSVEQERVERQIDAEYRMIGAPWHLQGKPRVVTPKTPGLVRLIDEEDGAIVRKEVAGLRVVGCTGVWSKGALPISRNKKPVWISRSNTLMATGREKKIEVKTYPTTIECATTTPQHYINGIYFVIWLKGEPNRPIYSPRRVTWPRKINCGPRFTEEDLKEIESH